MNEAVKVTVSNETISILELMLQASLLVQLVMLLLILASLASWVVIFTKSSTLKNLRLESDNFDSEFWSGGELNGLYRRYTEE
ncbi:MAG: protein TolQ, partial [Gammaproteobacteria bacterium]